MPSTTIPPSIYITLRLDILSGLMKERAEAAHQARDGVSVREVRLLLLVRKHPGITMGRLVELSFMEKTMVSKAVTALTRAGLIQREIGESDARQVVLALTRKGKGVAERAHRFVLDTGEIRMSVLTPGQRRTFDEALEKLTEHLLEQRAQGLDPLGKPCPKPPIPGDRPLRETPAVPARVARPPQRTPRKRAP